MKNMVVYCGSNLGQNKAYFEAAQDLGHLLAAKGYRLVYGGGKIGLMGAVADACLAAGGEVTGVIPTFLKEREMGHPDLTHMIETADMTTRKRTMIEQANGFIALPGGLGTYEELFEVLSGAQLKLHSYPVGILNVAGFFDPLVQMLQHTADQGFMPQENMGLLCVADNATELLLKMTHWQPRDAVKWMLPQWAAQADAPSPVKES